MVAIIRSRRNFRRGGIGLDSCLTLNQTYSHQHNITIPSNCFSTPRTNTTASAVGDTESTGDELPSTAINETAKAEEALIATFGSIGAFILLTIIIYGLWKCLEKDGQKRKKRPSSGASDDAPDGDSNGKPNSVKSVENSEKPGWISRIFRQGSQNFNDSAIELGDRTPIKRQAAAPGLHTPSQSGGFDSSSTLEIHLPGQEPRSMEAFDLEAAEGMDISAMRSPAYFCRTSFSEDPIPRTSREMTIPNDESTDYHPTANETSPAMNFSNPFGDKKAENRESFSGEGELDISETMAPVNHHEHALGDSDDDDSIFGRVSEYLNSHERLASVVILQKQRARKLDSRPNSSKSNARSSSSMKGLVGSSTSSSAGQSGLGRSRPQSGVYGRNKGAGSSLSVGSKRGSRFIECFDENKGEAVV